MKYYVTFDVSATTTIVVEADSEDDAKSKAWDEVQAPVLCHHCADEVEIGDIADILEVGVEG